MYEYQATIVSEHDGDTLRADVDLGRYVMLDKDFPERIDLGFGVFLIRPAGAVYHRVWLIHQDFRLNRINAPEITGEQKPLGQVTLDRLKLLLPVGITVTVKTTKDKLDKYGRMLGDFYLASGACVNDTLVTEGLAKYYDGTGPKPI